MVETNQQEVLPVSLIICSRNRPVLLEQAVDSVLQGTKLPSEIIIIDQSDRPHTTLSTAGSRRGCNFRYKWKADAGLSKARNAAIAVAEQALLAFIDDDVLAPPEWLVTIIRASTEAGPKSLIIGQVIPGEPEIQGGFSPYMVVDETPAVYCGRLNRDVLCTFNLAAPRESLRVVGGFDERLGPGTRFHAAEDNDIGLRLLEAGYRILYEPAVVVYHRSWRREYFSLRWRYGRGQGAYYAKYLTAYDHYGLQRLRSELGRRFVRWPYMLRHERHKAWGDLVYTMGLLAGAAEWLLRYRD
jgi:GT2 family glycosyltransferase